MEQKERDLQELDQRIAYLLHLKGETNWGDLKSLSGRCRKMIAGLSAGQPVTHLTEYQKLLERIRILEKRAAERLEPIERVRICNAQERFKTEDIIAHVYSDPLFLTASSDKREGSRLIAARATIETATDERKTGKQAVMVIGHGSAASEIPGDKTLSRGDFQAATTFMKLAEAASIPIHLYVSATAFRSPEGDYGDARLIANCLTTMSRLKVPLITMILEGAGITAEAFALADVRLMPSHGYYTVCLPTTLSVIEAKIAEGETIPTEILEVCAKRLKLTAADNLELGIIDGIVKEPPLGARADELGFFSELRKEMVRATDRAVDTCKSFQGLRKTKLLSELERRREEKETSQVARWSLSPEETKKLIVKRYQKYLERGTAFTGSRETLPKTFPQRGNGPGNSSESLPPRFEQLRKLGMVARKPLALGKIAKPLQKVTGILERKRPEDVQQLLLPYYPILPALPERQDAEELLEVYTKAIPREVRDLECPGRLQHDCPNLDGEMLYRETAGVCPNCGHHFPLNHSWYLEQLFDSRSISPFNESITAANPLHYTGFAARLQKAQQLSGRFSANLSFGATVSGVEVVVTMLCGEFRNGTVGAAEGQKFIEACKLADQWQRPLVALVHTTGGARYQEGCLALLQMTRCILAVQRFIDNGGLYLAVFDNNGYAEPVASFLGCAPYRFAVHQSRIGVADPRELREWTGDCSPARDHDAEKAHYQGFLHGVWDRRELRNKLGYALKSLAMEHP